MVKMTIEHEGKVHVADGEYVIALVLSDNGNASYAAHSSIIGEIAPNDLPQILTQNAISIIQQTAKDKRTATERILELSVETDTRAHEWVQKHGVDTEQVIVEKIRELMKEMVM